MHHATGPITWAVLAAGLALETVALKADVPSFTASHATRVGLHTDTTAGKVAFVTGWLALTGWFVPHILRGSSSLLVERPR